MTASTRKRYRINLVEWSSYVRWIEAESAEAAIERAENDFCEYGDEGFTRKDGSIECEVWEEEDIPADPA
ncbi:hypothetical protein W911_05960 [Hyphomicrobium nitrativorans NL23]|uniref:Uncharacterized protein n=1 Tax=Hyphomicrobium nitrativorans NL23 TaxID=1029756 RepID=V5SHM8_9HYPH|nr:hypothetical protein [Hyphomicrobium nitrativorans]AHB50007.1 hypothetical protein W911_05960 [Hyphomicrobium nitrativorans NL23]